MSLLLIPLITMPMVASPLVQGSGVEDSEWLVMFYMCAENNLAKLAVKDLSSILSFESEEVAVAVLYDDLGPTVLHLNRGGDREARAMGELNLGDPRVLSQFVEVAMATFPAEKTMLVVYGHGSAWRGLCWDGDEGSADQLTVPELSHALSFFQPFDIIFFHSCLMANVETLYQIRDRADLAIAPEDSLLGDEVNFKNMLGKLEGRGPEEAAKMLVDEYMDMRVLRRIAARIKDLDVGLGVIDLDELGTIVEKIDDLAQFGSGPFDGLDLAELEKYGTVDLYSLASKVAKSEDEEIREAATELAEAIEKSVIYLSYNDRNCHGLSITFPREVEESWRFEELYSELDFSSVGSWDEIVFNLLSSPIDF
jgi:hypothetical protein